MKNQIAITLICLFTSISLFAQKSVGTPEQLKAFLKTTTLVVLDDNPLMAYNPEMKETVQKFWTITKYEFISNADYDKKRKDPKYSFLTLDQVFYDKDNTKAQYNFLCLSLGGSYKTQSDMPQLCTVPLSYLGVDEESYVYKIGTLIKFIQNHVKITSENPNLKEGNIIKYYNENISSIKEKTLYLVRDELDPEVNSEAKIKESYPYKFKMVTREDVEKAIKNSDPNVVFLHKVGPEGSKQVARCFKVIMGASDAKLYYFDYHMITDKFPDGLMKKDFKQLSKQ